MSALLSTKANFVFGYVRI